MPATLSTVTVPVTIRPEVDTAALEASIRAAVASALRTVADELSPEKDADEPRWAVGQELTTADLEALPVGAHVEDRDGDPCWKRPASTGLSWNRNGGPDEAPFLTAQSVALHAPVTLVSLP